MGLNTSKVLVNNNQIKIIRHQMQCLKKYIKGGSRGNCVTAHSLELML